MWWKLRCSVCGNVYACCSYDNNGEVMPTTRVEHCFNDNGTLLCWEFCPKTDEHIQGICNCCRYEGKKILPLSRDPKNDGW